MPDNVRINVDINTNGTPELQQLAAAMRVIQEQAARQEAQLQSLSQGYQKLGQSITSALDTLGKSGVLGSVTTEAAQAVQALKTAGNEITGIVTNLNGQRVKLNVDSSEYSTASTRAKQFSRDIEAAKARNSSGVAANSYRDLLLSNAKGLTSAEAEQQVKEAKLLFAEVEHLKRAAVIDRDPTAREAFLPRRDALEAAESRLRNAQLAESFSTETAGKSGDVLAVPLRKLDNSGLDAQNQKLREGIALQTGGEEALLKLRIQDLEAVRQIGLAEAKTAEAQQRVNQSVDAAIAREKDHAGLVQELKLREEIAATETKFGALVEKTNQRELTGVQKIEAEREKNLKYIAGLEARAPDYKGGAKLREQINAKADADLKEESRFNFRGRRGLNGNVLQSALYAAQSPQYAAFSAVSGFAESLPAAGIAAGVAAVGVGVLGKAMYDLVDSAGKGAQELDDFARRLGITDTQAFRLAGTTKLIGINIETVVNASRTLSAALEDSSGQGAKVAAALQKLPGGGIRTINPESGEAREPGQVFLDVLTKLEQIQNKAERLDLANKLFPRGVAKTLEPYIEQAKELNAEFDKLGFSNRDELINRLKDDEKEIEKLRLVWGVFRSELAGKIDKIVIPVVADLTKFISGKGGASSQVAAFLLSGGAIPAFGKTPFTDDSKTAPQPQGPQYTPAQLADYEKGKQIANRALQEHQQKLEGLRELERAQQQALLDAEKPVRDYARDGVASAKSLAATQALARTRDALEKTRTQIKALEGGPRQLGEFERRIFEAQQQAFRLQYPASRFGAFPEIISRENILERDIQQADKISPAKKRELIQFERQNVFQPELHTEAQELRVKLSTDRYRLARVTDKAAVDFLERQFRIEERIAALKSTKKEGDPQLIEQAYQHDLALAQKAYEIHLKDAQIEQDPKLRKVAFAQAGTDFSEDQDKARIARQLALLENEKKERDEAKKDAEELAHIRNETELHGFQLQIEHAAHIAELTRDRESPVTALERAFETEKKLAQLAFDFETRENAVTFRDDPEKRKIEDEKARQRLIEDGQRSEYEREEKLAALRKQERDSSKAAAASLYDAIRGGSKGLHDFFKAQADKIGQNAFAALVGPAFGSVSKGLDPTGQGLIHDLVSGTIFGGSTGAPRLRPDEIGPVAAIPPGQELSHHSGFRNFLAALTTGIPERPTAPLITPSADIQAGVLAHPEFLASQQSQTISDEALQASIKQLAELSAAKLASPTSEISALIPHLDPVRNSLDTLRGSVDNLNATISAAPPIQSGTGTTASAPATGSPALTELQAHSLVHSSRNAVTAANKLANAPNEPVTANVDTAALTDALKQPKPPLVAPAQPTVQTSATTAATLQALRNTNALRESSVPPQIASGLQYVGIPAAQESVKAQAPQQTAALLPPALPTLPSPLAISTPPSIPGLKGRYSPLGVAEYIVPPTLRNQYLPNDSDAITSPAEGANKPRTLYAADLDTSEIRTHERIHQAQDQLNAPKPYQVAKAIAPIFAGDEKKANEYIRRVGLTDVDGEAIRNTSEARKQGAAEAPAYLFQAPPAVNSDKQYLEGLEPQTGLEGYQNAYNNYVNLLKALNPGKPVGIEQVAPPEFQQNYLKTQASTFETLPPQSTAISPHGFETLGELASSDITNLRGLFAGPSTGTPIPRESFPVKPPSLGLHITGPLPEPAPLEPNTLQRFASAANPLPALQGTIQEYINRPAEIRKQFDALGAFQEQDKSGKPFTAAQKARIEAAMNANLPSADGNLLAEQLAPLVKASEQIGKGDLAGASGTVIGSAAPFLIGKGLGFAGASLPEVAAGLKTLQEHPLAQALLDEEGGIGPRAERALSTYKPSTQAKQTLADQSEAQLSKALRIPRTTGNAPFDLQNEQVGIEVKTLLDNSNDKITMHPESLERKRIAAEQAGITPYTVAVDKRGAKSEYYLREGLGSFRIGAMDKVPSLAALRRHLFDETGSVGPGSGKRYNVSQVPDNGPGAQLKPLDASTASEQQLNSGKQLEETVRSIVSKRLSHDEMLARGADGYLSHAVPLDIPVNKIVGREPIPAMEGGYQKGTPITQPIEVVYDPEQGYVLHSGNHRVRQAEVNESKTIPAYVQFDKYSDLKRVIADRAAEQQINQAIELKPNVPAPKSAASTTNLSDTTSDSNLAALKRTLLDETGSVGPGSGRTNAEAIRTNTQSIIDDLKDRHTEDVGGRQLPTRLGYLLKDPISQQAISDNLATLLEQHGNPDTIPTYLGKGLDKTVYDIGNQNVLKIGHYPWPPNYATERAAQQAGIERHLGEYAAPALQRSQIPVGRNALELEVQPKLTVLPDLTSHDNAVRVWKDTGVLVDNIGPGNFGQDRAGKLKVLDTGDAYVASADEAARRFEITQRQSTHPAETTAIPRTDPVIAALATNTDATKSLTDAILNVTPGGGVGPNPLAQNPLPAAAIAPGWPGAATGAGADITGNIAGDITGVSLPELPGPDAPYTPTIVLPPSAADLTASGSLPTDISPSTPTNAVAPTATTPATGAHAATTKPSPIAATQSALHELSHFSSAVHGPAGQAFGAAGSVGGILQNIQDLRGALAARHTRQYEQAYHRLPVPGHAGDLTLPNLDLPAQQAGLSPHGFATLPQQFASIGDTSNLGGILDGGNSYSDQSLTPATEGLAGQFGGLPGAPAFQESYQSPALGTLGSASEPLPGAPPYTLTGAEGPASVSAAGVPTYTALATTTALPESVTAPALSAVPTALDQQITTAYPSINAGSTGVLPQSVLDAASPFNNPLAALKTLNTGLQDLSAGFGAGGLGSSSSSGSGSSLLSTPISRLFGLGDIAKDKKGSTQQIGDIVSTGATVTAGALAAISGFKRGGARGDLQGVGSILGTAAVLDPEPISKAVLGIAAGITAMISAFLPDPRAQREKQLTKELFNQKIAAEPFVQPGINVEESATGRAISTDYLGDPRALNARPLVYTIREAIGFNPLHGDRVVTAPVRQVGIGPLGGFANPVAAQSQLVSTTPPNLPLGSRDTNPLVMSGNGPANTFRSGTQQDSARQDGPQQQAPPFTVNDNRSIHVHAMDTEDFKRRGDDIATALIGPMQGTHRIVQEIRNINTQT